MTTEERQREVEAILLDAATRPLGMDEIIILAMELGVTEMRREQMQTEDLPL